MGILENKSVKWQPYLWKQSHPASLRDIERVETALELRFPKDYRVVAIQHQGEVPQQNLFDFVEKGQQTTSVMGVLFHFLEDKSEAGYYSYNLLENYRNRQHLLPAQIIPFSEDPAGNSIAFDFRKATKNPSIVFVNHEAIDEVNKIVEIATNFSEFQNFLYEDTNS